MQFVNILVLLFVYVCIIAQIAQSVNSKCKDPSKVLVIKLGLYVLDKLALVCIGLCPSPHYL